jgi:hypothetical protein
MQNEVCSEKSLMMHSYKKFQVILVENMVK